MKVIFETIDTHPANSLALMFRSIGWEVFMVAPDHMLTLRKKKQYHGGAEYGELKNMGYCEPNIPYCTLKDIDTCDLYVVLKVPDADFMAKLYPHLEKKILVYLINGGRDDYEAYGTKYPCVTNNFFVQGQVFHMWSPVDNVNDWKPKKKPGTESPVGLLHGPRGWGFGFLMEEVIEKTGLRIYGGYGAPNDVIHNSKVGELLTNSSCFIHLKASDCPGWALYEAFATATPVVIHELLPLRMGTSELFNEKTCMVWGQGSYEVMDEFKIVEQMENSKDMMIQQIVDIVEQLKDPKKNKEIGMAGHEQWKKLTAWTDDKKQAFDSFIQTICT